MPVTGISCQVPGIRTTRSDFLIPNFRCLIPGMIRKTSLLRIVPMACGQAANKAPRMIGITNDASHETPGDCGSVATLRHDRFLGAILPLHDVRYHAPALKPRGSMTDAKRFLCERAEKQPPGGARRDRTDDLLLAKQALSQLSYGPDRISDHVIAEIGGPGK